MPADTSTTDALLLIRDILKTVTPASGFTFDLSVADAVDLGRFLQPPQTPAGPPFVRIAELEELAWEEAPNGKQVRQVVEYLIVGWVKGENLSGGTNSKADRIQAASLLKNDIHSILLENRRLPRPPLTALASNLTLRGSSFDGAVANTARDYAITVLMCRVQFPWKTP